MQDGAGTPDQHKQNKSVGNNFPERFIQEKDSKFQNDRKTELALASEAIAKCVGYFDRANLTFGGRQKVEQNLEAFTAQVVDGFSKKLSLNHEETAHRIRDVGLMGDDPTRERRHVAVSPAVLRPIPGASRFQIAAADSEIVWAVPKRIQHLLQNPGVVLQVGVHHSEIGRQ